MVVRIRRPKPAASFVHPLDPAPRTAILVSGFKATRSIRVFPHGWSDAAARFVPESVAGTFEQLLLLAGTKVVLSHALICLAWDQNDLLSSGERDLLWNLFGIPLFEQYLDSRNRRIAYECEAHSGLHATPAFSGPTGPRCPCGTGLLASMDLSPEHLGDAILHS
jgi:hypothetical protein